MMPNEAPQLLTEGMHNIPIEVYAADPCPEPSFTSGAAKMICSRSPLHAWQEHPRLNPSAHVDVSTKMDVGSAAHALFLEGDDSRLRIIDADDFRTKAARAERDKAHANGLIPLLEKHADDVRGMVRVVREALGACAELPDYINSGWSERSLIWKEGDTWCRARPDWIAADKQLIINYKTTSTCAEPESFGTGLLMRNGYHLQAYHHMRGLQAVKNVDAVKHVWIAQETTEPYAVSFLGMSPALMALAKTQWKHALELWRNSLASNAWPGYPARVCWVEPKPWTIEQWVNRPNASDDEITAILN
jgi:hypothetical protein